MPTTTHAPDQPRSSTFARSDTATLEDAFLGWLASVDKPSQLHLDGPDARSSELHRSSQRQEPRCRGRHERSRSG